MCKEPFRVAVWPLAAMAVQVRCRRRCQQLGLCTREPAPACCRGWLTGGGSCERRPRLVTMPHPVNPPSCSPCLRCLQVANHLFQWLDGETMSYGVNAGRPHAATPTACRQPQAGRGGNPPCCLRLLSAPWASIHRSDRHAMADRGVLCHSAPRVLPPALAGLIAWMIVTPGRSALAAPPPPALAPQL